VTTSGLLLEKRFYGSLSYEMIDSLFEGTTDCPNGQGGSNRGLAYGGANPLLTPRLGFTRALRPGCSRVDDLGAHCPPSPFAD